MNDLPPVKVPRVARASRRAKVAPLAFGMVALGTAVFASLANHRAAHEEQSSELPPLRGVAVAQAPVAPVAPTLTPTPATPPLPMTSVAPVPSNIPLGSPVRLVGALPPPPAVPRAPAASDRVRDRLNAPALIVDLSAPRSGETLRPTAAAYGDGTVQVAQLVPTVSLPVADPTGASIRAAGPPPDAVAAGAAAGAAAAAGVDPGTSSRDLNSNERFASRAGNREVEVARAQRLINQNTLVTQGTIIGAVMETALDSDLPGFAKALVTNDVLSFDGSRVMIPAGSHVIGEYNSGVAQGASRIFIVWNRLIRPDGVSIALGSPAVDDLGRGGLGGKVNRHFFQRFGGAILLSVLSGGFNALTQSLARGSTVVVSSTNEATSLAGQASRGSDIAPTIKTRQGAAVRIFVARDLDFSSVGAAS